MCLSSPISSPRLPAFDRELGCNTYELAMDVGDLVEVLGAVDERWWLGRRHDVSLPRLRCVSRERILTRTKRSLRLSTATTTLSAA